MGLSIFNILKEEIRFQFRDFREFVGEASLNLSFDSNRLATEFEEIAGLDPDSKVLEAVYEEYSKYSKTYVRFLFNPMLLMAYSYFEYWLKKVCEFDHRKGFSKIKVSDLHGGNYIEKSRTYLTKVAGINLDDKEAEWNKIKEIQKIRNRIAHHLSNVPINQKQGTEKGQHVYHLIKNEPMISIEEYSGDFYITDKQYIFNAVELFQEYLFDVIDRVEQIKVSVKNTTLPHEMSNWGLEKTETLLSHLVSGLETINQADDKINKHDLLNTLSSVEGTLSSMAWNLTKLYSLFTGAQWNTGDEKLIQQDGAIGLEKLKKRYTKE